MPKRILTLFGVVMALAAAGLATEAPASATPPPWAAVPACPGSAAKGSVNCHAWITPKGKNHTTRGATVLGMSPATIKTAYNFPTNLDAGAGQTIAIVDAYDSATVEKDLGVFSKKFGLPSCTTRNGCFTKVDQNGGTSYPRTDARWALEIALDVQWAHAIAPGAKILLVEANSSDLDDLVVAESYANTHARYVSNSWGGGEFADEAKYDKFFGGPDVSTFVSAGDSGQPAEYPSASPNVISVGGTKLFRINGTGPWTENAWSNGGGGCSAYEPATAAQSAFSQYGQVNCGGKRATPDVSLDADPQTGVAVYDSTPYQGQQGWFVVGGTSASAPMWAARAAVSGKHVDASFVYGSSIAFRDILNGTFYTCLPGFDLCTGRGSWVG